MFFINSQYVIKVFFGSLFGSLLHSTGEIYDRLWSALLSRKRTPLLRPDLEVVAGMWLID